MPDTSPNALRIAFWGNPEIAVYALNILHAHGITPELIICAPDKPRGRKHEITPPETKVWAQEHDISVLQPTTLKDTAFVSTLKETPWDLFIVFAYGLLMPKSIISMPTYGTLNIHPSMLPKLRGASPIQSAILSEDSTGVSIMLMDDQMDHGPIIAQEAVPISPWPPKESVAEKILAQRGAEILADSLSDYINGIIKPRPQDDTNATFTRKITKEDGLIDLADDPETNLRKIRAYERWPRAFFLAEHKGRHIRVVITDADIEDGTLMIKKVIPEGKKEMDYQTFLGSLNQ